MFEEVQYEVAVEATCKILRIAGCEAGAGNAVMTGQVIFAVLEAIHSSERRLAIIQARGVLAAVTSDTNPEY